MKPKSNESGTQYFSNLDGLRGWAALMVVFNHLFAFFLLRAQGPSSSKVAELIDKVGLLGHIKFYLASIGVILYRFFTDGAVPVYVFFILSGFVLSYSFVKSGVMQRITDQALRRYIRLTVPITASCLAAYLLTKLGLIWSMDAGKLIDNTWVQPLLSWSPSIAQTLKLSLFTVYFGYDSFPTFNFALWTMQYEFMGSFLIFSTLAIFGKIKNRLSIYFILLAFFTIIQPKITSFLIGLLIAELHQRDFFRQLLTRSLTKWTLAVLWLGVIASPTLIFHHVREDLQPIATTIAATVIVISAMSFNGLSAFLSSRTSAYLGRVSFSLYLTHPLVIASLTCYLIVRFFNSEGLHATWLIASLPTLIVCFVVASLFSVFDRLGVQLSRRFSDYITGNPTTTVSTQRQNLDNIVENK